MNTVPSYQKEITLRNGVTCELMPAQNWRELAKKGVKSMHYRVSGEAVIGDAVRQANVYIPAIRDGQICGLGEAVPTSSKDGAKVEFVRQLLAKNGGLDSAKVAEKDGATVVGADGRPEYVEAPVVQDDGKEFDLVFGTHFFVPHSGGLTIRVTEASVSVSERDVSVRGIPTGDKYLNIRGLAHEVVAMPEDRAAGKPLTAFGGCKQAARRAKAPEAPATQAESEM